MKRRRDSHLSVHPSMNQEYNNDTEGMQRCHTLLAFKESKAVLHRNHPSIPSPSNKVTKPPPHSRALLNQEINPTPPPFPLFSVAMIKTYRNQTPTPTQLITATSAALTNPQLLNPSRTSIHPPSQPSHENRPHACILSYPQKKKKANREAYTYIRNPFPDGGEVDVDEWDS